MANTTSSNSTTRRFIKRQEVESITGLSCTEIYRRASVRGGLRAPRCTSMATP